MSDGGQQPTTGSIESPDNSNRTQPVTVLKGYFGPWKGPAVTIEEMNESIAQEAAEANK